MYHSQQHRMQNCQFLYLRESFGYNRELFVCPSCVHRVAIGRLRVCVGSILAFYQIREENRAKLKISYSCGHRVLKSARYDATCSENKGADQLRGYREADLRLCFRIGKNPVFSRCGSLCHVNLCYEKKALTHTPIV